MFLEVFPAITMKKILKTKQRKNPNQKKKKHSENKKKRKS